MSFTDNINGIPAQDTVLRQGIATLRNTVISNTIKPLTANQNGVYTADPNNGTYGYSPVTVDTGVYTGVTAPDNSLGKDGDYYYKITDLKTSISFNKGARQNSITYRLGHAFYVDEPIMIYGFSGYYRHANDNIKFLLLDDQANIIYESTTVTSVADEWNNLVIDTPISIEANKIYWVMMDMPSDYGCYVNYDSSNVWSNFNNIHIEKGIYYQNNSYSDDNYNIYMATVLVKQSYYNISNEYVKNNNAWILLSSTDKIQTTTLSVDENGTYNAPTGTAYSSVTVNVPSSGGGTGLPTGYTAIEYIECPASGQAGFVLENLTIDAYDVIEFLTMPYEVPSSDEAAFAGIEDMYEFYYNDGSALVWVDGSEIMVFDYQERPVAVANTQYYHKSLPTDYYTGDFAVGYYSLGNYQFKGRIYKFKIHRNSDMYHDIATVYDFRPCTRDSDGKVGMYDIVNDVFYSSTTGTEFVAPPSNN